MLLNKYQFFFIILLSCSISFSQTIDHWETIIGVGDSCMYFIPSSEIGDSWKTPGFADSNWVKGQSGLGYGDDDDNTELPAGTRAVYMRFAFTIDDISDIAVLFLDMDYDDGFVAYLNGSEVARAMVTNPVTWDMDLERDHEAQMHSGGLPERFILDDSSHTLLITGENIIAIEVHNRNATSSDLSSNVFLNAGIVSTDTLYGPVPDWFWIPVSVTGYNLPLMLINTNGRTIPDEPPIIADMGLVSNGNGKGNFEDDPPNEYSGRIIIERRGESSYGFAKRSYRIELQKEDGSNNNVSLLGLPEENDFVLYGPYSDKTMIKNVLAYALYRRTGRWAPRTRYIEVILNNEYQGVYVLTEKLKRDKNRVDIDRLDSEDTSAVDISGGYILRRDKTDGVPAEAWWRSPVNQPYHERMWYQYFDPGYEELTPEQTKYIRDWMKGFDEVMSATEFDNSRDGYRKYIDVQSFIDMMFINEITKGIDNYLFSTYFYKENDEDGGQLVAGPPWDYNLGYGNLDYGDDWNAKESYGWCYTQGSRVYWFERLMEDSVYQSQVYCRWAEFRENIFSDESVMAFIDSCVTVLGDAVARNFRRYPTLGQYVWPAIEPYPTTYEGEIENLKTWLLARLSWMDSQWLSTNDCTAQPPTDIRLNNNSILENVPAGTELGMLSTTDADDDEHYYSLISGKSDGGNDKFYIEDDKVFSNMVFDYNEKNDYSIRIKSEDKRDQGFEKVFEVNILENPTSEVEGPVEIPAEFSLQQNYPNPFNPTTTISYSLPESDFIQLKIYDTLGKEVATLVSEEKVAGYHNVEFNASGLPSGIYFYRIICTGIVQTKKLILLR